MDASLTARVAPFAGPRVEAASAPLWITAAVIAAAALLIRSAHFGDPAYHIDDQFYLFTGRALLEGELPYVDIWDRKPIGLFLIYAAIGLLGGDGIVQYQLVAGLFAAATAFTIALIARRTCGAAGACLAGIAYLATIELIGGGGGQSPVFYNLLIANAALLTLRALDLPTGPQFLRTGAAAMALAGLALAVKQIAVVEGCFFGLVLVWTIWRRTGAIAPASRAAFLFAAIGAAPTAAAFLAYAALGQGEAWWFANISSIFLKPPLGLGSGGMGLLLIAVALAPLALCAAFGLARRPWRGPGGAARDARFIAGWTGAALIGLLAIPNFFDHYALPLTVPLSVAAAGLFDSGRRGLLIGLLTASWGVVMSAGGGAEAARLSARLHQDAVRVVARHLRGGCLYVYEGPVNLYQATGACRASAYVFPDHLNSALEAHAIGIRPEAEVRALLARRPSVIVMADRIIHPTNRATRTLVDEALKRRYRHVAALPVAVPGVRRTLHIWALREAPPAAAQSGVSGTTRGFCDRHSSSPPAMISAAPPTVARSGASPNQAQPSPSATSSCA